MTVGSRCFVPLLIAARADRRSPAYRARSGASPTSGHFVAELVVEAGLDFPIESPPKSKQEYRLEERLERRRRLDSGVRVGVRRGRDM